MPNLILEIHSLDDEAVDTVMIEGDNPTHALSYLEENETPFPVKLWRERYRGREFLGEVQRDQAGVWHILETEPHAGEG
ncbi:MULTISPECIES: hypothetical protein [unclassified Erythrobacter]|uniref:hypothetical protein n=1 Tax=unclassified Erythrobacter TaxID=2633097 RepID=UPI00076BD346|nr:MULTISPECIES: hypothetical protein [unclassified Erythrobacter]KWV95527.1 hypothetical protein ASS64_16060 [Erythrobacter sp. AP23]MBO6730961.1 hypothetical protein [Maricaulis sp.]MBO6767383.1 hypothetical protein [Erythrobacter sp.]